MKDQDMKIMKRNFSLWFLNIKRKNYLNRNDPNREKGFIGIPKNINKRYFFVT